MKSYRKKYSNAKKDDENKIRIKHDVKYIKSNNLNEIHFFYTKNEIKKRN